MQRGFSRSTVKIAASKMMQGIKPEYHISDRLSREDIERAWHEASLKVFGGKNDRQDKA